MYPGKILKILLKLALAVLFVYFLIQPYNWYCSSLGDCKTISLSRFIQRKAGRSVELKLEITNYRSDVTFTTQEPVVTVITNEINNITYKLKNSSRQKVTIRPEMFLEPENAKDFLETFKCLCSRSITIKPQEEVELNFEFLIDDRIFLEEVIRGNDQIKIRFKI